MRVVITGGPSAGKTTVATALEKEHNHSIFLVKEAASILYGGGFPREVVPEAKICQQKAIFSVQRELEDIALKTSPKKLFLCDRGTLDGLAYWTGSKHEFFAENQTSEQNEIDRYDRVIHLQVAPREDYNSDHSSIRVESWEQAVAIDERIKEAWKNHPHYSIISNEIPFWQKIEKVNDLVQEFLEIHLKT